MLTWTAYAPSMLAVAGAIVALLLDAWERPSLAAIAAAAFVGAGGVAAGVAALGPRFVADGVLRAGGTASVGSAACLLLAAIAIGTTAGRGASAASRGRSAVLGALAAASCAVVASSFDVVVLLLGIETLSLCGFGLVALSDSSRSRESAMKWFVQSAVAATLLVIGVGVLFAAGGGSASFSVAASPLFEGGRITGVALVLSALAFKAGAFPFHSWAPDVYETAPAPAAALLASAGKIAALVAIGSLLAAESASAGPRTAWALAALATGSIVFGNLAALRQRALSRMLAYSGIAQVGYALVGVASGSARTATAITLAAVAYGLAACGAFLTIAAIRETDPGWDGTIERLAGLSARRPAIAASLAVFMLSLTGIPLTVGFWGKFAVFGAATAGGLTWLAVLGVVGSVVSFGYYGGVLRAAYLEEAPASEVPAAEVARPRPATNGGGSATIAVVLLGIAVAVLGTAPFFSGIQPLLGALFGVR